MAYSMKLKKKEFQTSHINDTERIDELGREGYEVVTSFGNNNQELIFQKDLK